MKKKKCSNPNCENRIQKTSKYCYSCRNKYNHKTGILNSKGINNPMYEKKHTKKAKDLIAKAQFGRKKSLEERQKISDGLKGHKSWNKGLGKDCFSSETLELLSKRGKETAKILWSREDYRDKQSLAMIKRWSNKKDREILFAGYRTLPNIPEKKLRNILNILFPKEYRYVGDGKIWIKHFNPDFVNCNGQKKIIELYGDYWHNLPKAITKDKLRIKTYKKYGYKTLIVWENELKNTSKLEKKLLKFNKMKISAEETE